MAPSRNDALTPTSRADAAAEPSREALPPRPTTTSLAASVAEQNHGRREAAMAESERPSAARANSVGPDMSREKSPVVSTRAAAVLKASISYRIKSSIEEALSLRWMRGPVTRATSSARTRERRSRMAACTQQLAVAFKEYVESFFRLRPLPPSKDGRHIPLNPPSADADGLVDERSNKPYVDNFIRSSRYTIYDFLPKQLMFQFSKVGNFYFLVMGILQMIPGMSTVGRWTTVVPLGIFVAFSMAKEGLDDFRRYRLDKLENRSEACILAGRRRRGRPASLSIAGLKDRWRRTVPGNDGLGHIEGGAGGAGATPPALGEARDWLPTQWQHLQVGDVVRLRRNQAVPADLVLLHATGPNGIAYIETMALDGETNLKSKQACQLLAGRCSTLHDIKSTRATVVSEDPNPDLYNYDGRVAVDGQTAPLSLKNIVYRGSTLRNTAEAVGLVVNSGEECKIRMNANKEVHAKMPAIQTIINKMVLFQILVVCALAGGLTIGYSFWDRSVEDRSPYLVRPGLWDASVSYKHIMVGYIVMFNTLIPLSLYISMEIIKIGQLILMHDVDMYDPVTDTPMAANTATILEDLGQVSYVFSDKTGTLTENIMRFRKLSVAGVACLHDMDVLRDEEAKRRRIEAAQKRPTGTEKPAMACPRTTKPSGDDGEGRHQGGLHNKGAPPSGGSLPHRQSAARQDEGAEMKTEELLDYLRRKPNTTFARKAKHFLLCVALCHTCLPEIKDDGALGFQAASPDELALVEAARDLGMLLIDRPAHSIKLQTRDADGCLQVEAYDVLDVIEFSSRRKRMSIVIRMPDGRICVFCKGADNVITPRLKLSHLAEQKAQDISRRASMRKTLEQDMAMRRASEQASARGTPRTSFALGRAESGDRLEGLRLSMGRRSTDLARLSESEGVAAWLNRRQKTEETAAHRASTDVLRVGCAAPLSDTVDGKVDEAVAANEAAVFEKCYQHVDDFASEGLRTLLYAYRYLDEDTYAKWKQLYQAAETSVIDRQKQVEEAGEQLEQRLELAGATAIEDKLQDGVPETIDKLRRANVKVWMLTGDKRETAINIGHSARLCKAYSELYVLDSTGGSLRETMTATLTDVCRGMVPHSVVVVDGQTLAAVEADAALAELFNDLVVRVDSVICCRASPSQKAELVKAIRRRVPQSMTLAIGDGANDIGMIQASHVGIGISGREGLQAARIADYSIAQFRFLQKLLFVHGRWNYLRTGKYVLATFWKEMLFFLVQAHYQRMNGYSGTSLFESWSLTVFNSAFTSLPVILLGVLEKDLEAETLLAMPELYTFGQQGRGFNGRQFAGWVAMGVAGSFVIFYPTWSVFRHSLFTNDTSLFAMGSICFTIAVIFINVKLLILELHSKTVVTFAGFFVSVAGWFLWNVVLSASYSMKVGPYTVRHGFLYNFGRKLQWWATMVVGLSMLVVLELVVQAIRRVYWPTDQDLMQRMEKDAKAGRVSKTARAAASGEVEEGEKEGERQDAAAAMDRGRGEQATAETTGRPRWPSPHTPRVSHEQGRRPGRASHDDYRPPTFTPPAEEREHPFEARRGQGPR